MKINDTPHETVTRYPEVYEYFNKFTHAKRGQTKQEKKYLLLNGGTADEHEDIVSYFWDEKEETLKSEYQFILKREIDCFLKDDDEVENQIFVSNKDEIGSILNIQLIADIYEYAKAPYVNFAKQKGGKVTIKTIIENLNNNCKRNKEYIKDTIGTCKEFNEKAHDPTMCKLRTARLDGKQQDFIDGCKSAFKELEKSIYVSKNIVKEFTDELEGIFFFDLLGHAFPFDQYYVLILYGVSYDANNVWNRLIAEDLNSESEFKLPDFIIATTEYRKDIVDLHKVFRNMFEIIDLSEKEPEAKQESETKHEPQQEVKSIANTLSYDKTTGIFKFGRTESITVSSVARAKKRVIAEQLMEYWQKGESCPRCKIVKDPRKKTPQSIYDSISAIRKTLKDVRVNMPQCSDEAYSPPSEPKYFDIIKKLV